MTTLLELGSGGGHLASRLPADLTLTLSDRSPAMLALSRELNRGFEHVQGDLRTLDLGRAFDAVLLHDAAAYLLTEADLIAAVATAWQHLHAGGAALFLPDFTAETLVSSTSSGGFDRGTRGARYLEWVRPDAAGPGYTVDYAFLLREGHDVRVERDRHRCAAHRRDDWLTALRMAGFEASALSLPERLGAAPDAVAFVGIRQ